MQRVALCAVVFGAVAACPGGEALVDLRRSGQDVTPATA